MMLVLPVTLTVLSMLILAVWTTRHILIHREKHHGDALDCDSPVASADAPMVSVILAAKDEQANIEQCARSILAQEYPNFEVIICDDRSSDETGAIADRLAAEDARVRVVHVASLPNGWCGKNHAVWKGWQIARGQWLCTTDADCRWICTRTLSVAMRRAIDSKADLLSVLPVLKTASFWEDVVQPVCGGIMMIWFNPDKVSNPDKPNAYANGAFLIIRQDAYKTIGTHEAIRGLMMEDMHLARRVKQAGLSLRVVRGRGLYEVRMYESLSQILRGWCRIFLGSFEKFSRLAIGLAVLMVMGVMPYATAAIGLSLACDSPAWLACGLAGTATVLMQLSVICRFYKLIGSRMAAGLLYLPGCLIASGTIICAMTKLRRGAKLTWRGTSYKT